MSSSNIDVGDIVNIYFTTSNCLRNVRVLSKPCDVGDSWYLESTEIEIDQEKGQKHCVILFERMDKCLSR